MRDVPLWMSRTKVALRRNSQRVATSQDNNSRVLRFARGGRGQRNLKGLKGARDSRRVEHKGHTRLYRTSVKIQSTYKSLYNQSNASS